ncbi:N,N'-diacetylbacillosaminyl-diphospho-undecaprenol alpha-1,3-N-acetylgalactosaminyltransferase [Caballeronia sp. SBC1]|uniref:glycosyltransferase family 4 protein n=1 Tax=Caballeronia sp. SBC1 TaxID=2705548 RepID=UPI001408ECC3|nr:glycosyltransferase family 4 protein [Caballeronia sp. SBC1]QIN62822.1 N,N'-diacetylbacillosaminyl-diphospho-undecaprenol alpha-1,3-N-acetylgalactosaminyltransferase [Caballeronia sp. SBC1]
MSKVILFANTDWYLFNFRLSLARALRELGHDVVLMSPPGEYGPELRTLGFRWEPVPMVRRSLNPLRELTLLIWLVRFLRREHPDLVHGFTIKCAVYGSLSARLAGVAGRVNAVAGMGYVFTSRDLKARLLRPVVRSVMSMAMSCKGSIVILQNPDDHRLFREANIVDESAIRIIKGSGVNMSRFNPRPEGAEPCEGEPLRVVLAGRLLWDKGIAEYVHAARLLKSEGRNVRCILAGSPDPGNPASVDEASLQGWIKEGLVEWLGHVSDMPKLFAQTDVAVLPSYREGLPKSMIEAAACALPLIITDAPGCREVVSINGEEGLVVPVGDGNALADAIRLLDDDRALARKLGRAARQKALHEFDERIVIERTLAVYRELLEQAPQALPQSGSIVS